MPTHDSRESSRKRKSASPQDEPKGIKKRRRRAAQAADVRIQALPKALQPKTPQGQQAEIFSSDEEETGDVNVLGHKPKSILRPSGGKSSQKGPGRRKGLRRCNGSEDEGNDDEADQSQESPITTLRSAKDLEMLTNPPPENNSSREVTPEPKYLPRKYLELKLVEYDLPSMEPQGPGDLWTCTFEGCFHRVHEASSADGKERIKKHFKTHATSAQEKIDLVLNESRPYLPVKWVHRCPSSHRMLTGHSNLMRRLQAFAPSPDTEPPPDSLQRKFSAPIRRRYWCLFTCILTFGRMIPTSPGFGVRVTWQARFLGHRRWDFETGLHEEQAIIM